MHSQYRHDVDNSRTVLTVDFGQRVKVSAGPITFVLSERCVLFSSQPVCDTAHHLHSAWIESLIETGERQHDQLLQRCMRVQQSTEALARNAAERARRFIERRDTIRRKFIELCSTFSFF